MLDLLTIEAPYLGFIMLLVPWVFEIFTEAAVALVILE